MSSHHYGRRKRPVKERNKNTPLLVEPRKIACLRYRFLDISRSGKKEPHLSAAGIWQIVAMILTNQQIVDLRSTSQLIHQRHAQAISIAIKEVKNILSETKFDFKRLRQEEVS